MGHKTEEYLFEDKVSNQSCHYQKKQQQQPQSPQPYTTLTKPKSWLDEGKGRETACILPPSITNPIQRIIITASGDLQRILSALYNQRIHVKIICNHIIMSSSSSPTKENGCDASDKNKILNIHRQVDLVCNEKVVCTATSNIRLISQRAKHLLMEEKVGIGQLFRKLGVNPEFELLDLVFSDKDSSFYRLYSLSSPDVFCEIKEEFPSGMLDSDFVFKTC